VACLGISQPCRRVGHPQGHSPQGEWRLYPLINELGVVLILLAMEAEGLVTLRQMLPILLLVLNVQILLHASVQDVPLGGAHSGSMKRLKLKRAFEEW
jgi:hypothetical protein